MKKSTILITGLFAVQGLFAQDVHNLPTEVNTCVSFHISQPLSDLFTEEVSAEPREALTESHDRDNRPAQRFVHTAAEGAEYGNDPYYMQTNMGTRPSPGTKANWLAQTGGGYPPDPVGAVGPTQYVQAVNATPVKIYSKTGTTVGTISNMSTLWSPATGDMGDPIVLYDKYADRWVLAQFGQVGATNYIYIAVSTTNNATGTYYTYSFTSASFPDYFKLSVWQDGYYMTSNQGGRMYCFERTKMLAGNPASREVTATYTTGATSGFYCPLPADADGGLPAVGAPLPIFAYSENAWGGGLIDGVQIWTMTVNWVPTTPTATIAATRTGASAVPTAAFDASYDPSWNDVSQPSTTQKLDGIGGVCTYRAQWRKWTGYNSVVLNWGIKISATQRSIKWVELRQDQTTLAWTLYQQGTYTPDAKTRWVGSIAMDDNGSIALCYARSSATAGDYPSLAYTGRLATDALGTMSFAETTAIAGTGSQTGGINRFGDYSCTTLDPADGVTFWHTGEYMGGATGSGALRTRVYSFTLPLPTGIEAQANTANLSVYQNEDQLMVKGNNLGSNDETVVDLFDMSGKQLAAQKVTPSGNELQTSFDVSALASGTYIVRIGRTNTSFQKVTKVNIIK